MLGTTELNKVGNMMARRILEAETPKAALGLMRPLRLYIALQGDHFCGSHGYPYLPVFSPDPEELSRMYPHATIVEYRAIPVRLVTSEKT